MTIALQPPQEERRSRRRYLLILPLLLSLFLAALGVFTLLIREGAAPRLELPSAVLGTQSGKARFDRWVEPVPRPVSVAVSPDGKRLYVAENAGSYSVRVFDTKGGEVTSFSPPHTTETTRQPTSIAVGKDGTVYVVERRLRQVLVFDADGEYRDILKPAGLDSWVPVGVAIDGSGLIYVSETLDLPDVQRHRIYVLKPDGTIVKEFGKKGEASTDLMFPGPLAVDDLGRIWVGDITGVKVFDASGAYQFRLGIEGRGAVALAGGLAFRQGRMYVTDAINHQVVVYKASETVPEFEQAFGTLGFGKGQFRYPTGIAVSASRIYIADRENGRVDIWTP